MSDVHENEKIDIDLKIREAEAYRSQELFVESLEIYEEILSVSPELDLEIRKTITEKISLLKEGIERIEKEDVSRLRTRPRPSWLCIMQAWPVKWTPSWRLPRDTVSW